MRIILIIAMLIAAFVLVPAAGAGLYFWRFYAPIPEADYPKPRDPAEARRQDLDHLARLPEFDRSFSEDEAAQFAAHITELRDQAAALSEAGFVMGVAKAAAITENGHTNLGLRALGTTLNSLPVRFFWFGDGLHIVRARAGVADLIGARVVAYDGEAPEALLLGLDPYIGGNDPWLRFLSPLFFASPMAMHEAGLAAAPDRVVLTLEDADGVTRDVELKPEDDPTPFMSVSMHPRAMPSASETQSGHDWRFLDPETIAKAHYGRRPTETLWSESLPGGGVYIRMRRIMGSDDNGTPISTWLKEVSAPLGEAPADYLVLDLRSNGGGDLTLTMTFARNIAELVTPDGHVYILTDNGTFSAALVTAAYARHGAGERSVIVGAHVGDDEQFWAEGGGVLHLPNSGLNVGLATGYHDWENGCTDWTRCYWLASALGVAAGPLDPDIAAPLTYADYAQGIDTAMQVVFEAEGIEAGTDAD